MCAYVCGGQRSASSCVVLCSYHVLFIFVLDLAEESRLPVWPVMPWDPPVSISRVLGLQMDATLGIIFTWILGIELMLAQHFTA